MEKILALLLILGVAFFTSAHGDTEIYSGNPFLPGDFADPAIIYEDGVFYIYITRQECANVWYSKDFVNWKMKELNWPTSLKTGMMWAPGIAKAKDGNFYLYYSLRSQIYAGAAENPTGPFYNLMPDEKPFIKDKEYFPPKIHTIDADVFVDDDGSAYLYWGSGWGFVDGICAVAPLNDDMVSFKEAPKEITPSGYFEAPHMFKRGGKYYLMYSDGLFIDDTYKVRYAVSDSPMGPFTEGKNSPVLVSDIPNGVSGPGHNFTIKIGDKMYIVYHRHEWPRHGESRQVCIDEMNFDDDGNILPIVPTERGVKLDFIKDINIRQTLTPARVEASSAAGKDYLPEKAVDGKMGTIWIPEGAGDSWFFADFGSAVEIAGIEPVFAEIKGGYDYKIEYSDEANSDSPKCGDVENWKVYAEGNNADADEWPIELKKKVKARFVKISVRGGGLPRYGLWEIKFFKGDK